jgi:16S rRNA (guanine527-N7)-methyltransferase
LGEQLRRGLGELGLALDEGKVSILLAYLELLVRWNRIYNLTAVREPAQMVTRHLLDSLAVAPHLHGNRLLDVGTGAGLPGLVLAVARPELDWVLLDSNRKKTRFCLQASAELGLARVQVVHSRLDDYRPSMPFSTVIARAFSQTTDWLWEALGVMAPGGRILLMKGARQVAGVRDCAKVIPLSVPGLPAGRHLVVLDGDCLSRRRRALGHS